MWLRLKSEAYLQILGCFASYFPINQVLYFIGDHVYYKTRLLSLKNQAK